MVHVISVRQTTTSTVITEPENTILSHLQNILVCINTCMRTLHQYSFIQQNTGDKMKNRKWFNEPEKRLHQSRIDSQLKTELSFLSMITGKPISNLTEMGIQMVVDKNRDKIQTYHEKQYRGQK